MNPQPGFSRACFGDLTPPPYFCRRRSGKPLQAKPANRDRNLKPARFGGNGLRYGDAFGHHAIASGVQESKLHV
jgi:hypothetical protein